MENKRRSDLIDDREGVEEARRTGLMVVGTLGTLERAAANGLLDLSSAFTRLQNTNFRVSRYLIERLLAQDTRRGKNTG